MMKKSIYPFLAFIFLIAIGFMFVYSSRTEPPTDINSQLTVSAVKLPRTLDFSGGKVPMNKYFVREKLDRELTVNTYWHSSTLLLLKRANRWFPVIEPILQEQGIPDDFKFLPLIESQLTHVVSPKGAAGYWQIMKGTAKDLGLEVTKEVDERYHLIKATKAACDYLNEAYKEFNDWTLVAASYNVGKRRIRESIEKQDVDNYYDLYLNSETARYVYRILAIKEIYADPSKYSFNISEDALYAPIETRKLEITESIDDLPAFAREQGIDYRTLKELNPWLRSSKLTVKKKKIYFIELPA